MSVLMPLNVCAFCQCKIEIMIFRGSGLCSVAHRKQWDALPKKERKAIARDVREQEGLNDEEIAI